MSALDGNKNSSHSKRESVEKLCHDASSTPYAGSGDAHTRRPAALLVMSCAIQMRTLAPHQALGVKSVLHVV